MATRIVMHVDMDAFYASVELRRRPELRGTPVIVGGSPRGVVLSATYEARAFGVRSGMPSSQALRLAPNATFLSPDFDSYCAVSKAIVEVFRSVTSIVESASIDEAFLDVTGASGCSAARPRSGSTCAPWWPTSSRSPARSASGRRSSWPRSPRGGQARRAGRGAARPGRRTSCTRCRWRPCGASGRPTAEQLHRLGIFTVGDLAHTPRGAAAADVRAALRCRTASSWPGAATPRRVVPIGARAQRRLPGDLRTGHLTSPRWCERELLRMADRTASRMRKAAAARPDGDHLGAVRRLHRADPVGHPADTDRRHRGDLRRRARLYDRLGLDRARIRRVGVRVEGLVEVSRAYRQPSLTDPERGWREADQAVDARRPAVRIRRGAAGRAGAGSGLIVPRFGQICSRETAGHLDWTQIRPTRTSGMLHDTTSWWVVGIPGGPRRLYTG